MDARTVHAFDNNGKLAVVEQQHISRMHVFVQILIRHADRLRGAGLGIHGNIENERRALDQHDASVDESLDTDLGSAQIARMPT